MTRIKGATTPERYKRELILETVRAIKRGGDYSKALSDIFGVHGSDPDIGYRFSNVAARAMQINMSPLVMLRNGSKRLAPDADSRVKELAKLYRKLDLALAVAKIGIAEKTILKIRRLHDEIFVENPKPI